MNRPTILYAAFFLLAVLAVGTQTYGQGDTRQALEPSYDVSLQLIIGSNEAVKSADLGQGLAAVSRQLRTGFPFAGYRLAATFMGRISNTGNYEYKSVANIFGQESEPKTSPTFLEWSVGNFRNGQSAKGEPGFQAQYLKFGARVPLTAGGIKDDMGKPISTVNYESIGLSLGKVGFAENSPTLIGTLNLPGTEGTMFLVMTVRPAER